MSKKLIICHGDGDGIISAAVLLKQIPDAEVIITQPFLIGKVSVPDDVEEIYVVDIAVDNKNPQQTIDFATTHADKIALWIDHHVGGEVLADILFGKFVWNPEMDSCPEVLVHHTHFNFFDSKWINAANACDRPAVYPATKLSNLYSHAFKVALVELQEGNKTAVEKIQRQFINYLLTGEKGDLQVYADRYAPLLENTKKAVESMTELLPGVGHIVLGAEAVDKTALCTEGYKRFPFVVIQFVSADNGERVTMVATNTKTNLVEVFGLKGGAPFRINLSAGTGYGSTHAEQLETVKKVLGSLS